MPVARGTVRSLEPPIGGGLIITNYEYEDGSTRQRWAKSRMVFPLIQIGDTTLKRAFVATDGVGHALVETLRVGDEASLYYFRHLLRKHVIIGGRSETTGQTFAMEAKGVYFGAILWYGLFSAFGTGLLGLLAGLAVAMMIPIPGAGLVVIAGTAAGIGVSWRSWYRLKKAWDEMKADGVC